MSSKFSRWVRSKAGTQTLIGILAVVVVLAIVGQLLGWWATLGELITGTVIGPPPGGYTCLPMNACAEDDGRFISHVGEDMYSFSGNLIVART